MRNSVHTGSKHFVLQSLAEGIFSAIAKDGGSAISNSGIIDLGGLIFVFDTFLTPQAAKDLRLFAEQKMGGNPKIVINSHYHNDHVWGNQVFAPDAYIISSVRTRDLMVTAGMDEFHWYSENSAQRLESLRSQFDAGDEQQRSQLSLWIGYYEVLVDALPYLSVQLPGITFHDRLEIHGSRVTAKLITYEGAHTESDTVLYLPQEGIVFMSDLLFVGCHPYLADGNPLRLLQALRELGLLDAACFIPGHGPAGTRDDLQLLIEYIGDCMQTAQGLINVGNYTDRIAGLKVPDRYTNWQLSQFYQANIRFLCQRLDTTNENEPA